MALVAEYELGCEALPLVDVAAAVPAADIEVEIGPTQSERPTFGATVSGPGDALAAVEDVFESTPFVGEYTLVSRDEGTRQYKIQPGTSMAEQLGDHLDDLDDLRALYTSDLQVDRIRATPTGWVQHARFAHREAFDELRSFWQRNDAFTLRKLTREDATGDQFGADPDDGLTDPQREAVRTAYEMGYFEIPRTATLEDVADELGISASACSERLRRAQTALVETHVADLGREDLPPIQTPHD